MRECKRLIKEFDREIKDEDGRNLPEVNKQLNDEKQSMIKELNSYVALRKTYMNTLGNKKLELFDTGAGASEPIAEENVQLASDYASFCKELWTSLLLCSFTLTPPPIFSSDAFPEKLLLSNPTVFW
ncbi:hypothetical protein JHK87_027283 [Glycine soja]|nr:hypothetical protein JHK87_027283 [Glycine soja]